MKIIKIILLVIFGMSLYGQFSMLAKGESNGDIWTFLPIILVILIIIFLFRSIGRENENDKK